MVPCDCIRVLPLGGNITEVMLPQCILSWYMVSVDTVNAEGNSDH